MQDQNSDNQQSQEQASEDSAARLENYDHVLANQFAALPMAMFIDQREGRLTHMDVCVYCFLLTAQRKNASSYWGIERLSLLTGISETGIKTSIRRLKKCGHIERNRTKLTTHTTCLTKVESDKRNSWIRVKGKKGPVAARK